MNENKLKCKNISNLIEHKITYEKKIKKIQSLKNNELKIISDKNNKDKDKDNYKFHKNINEKL